MTLLYLVTLFLMLTAPVMGRNVMLNQTTTTVRATADPVSTNRTSVQNISPSKNSASTGGYAQTCKDARLVVNGDGTLASLQATCLKFDGTFADPRSINLDLCLGNNDGQLGCFPSDGNFLQSCHVLPLSTRDSLVFNSTCFDVEGNSIVTENFDPGNCVANVNGQLGCA